MARLISPHRLACGFNIEKNFPSTAFQFVRVCVCVCAVVDLVGGDFEGSNSPLSRSFVEILGMIYQSDNHVRHFHISKSPLGKILHPSLVCVCVCVCVCSS